MQPLTLVYQGTNQPVCVGDLFYIKGEAHKYVGDWDILDTMPGGTLIVETDKAIVDAYKLGVELAYMGVDIDFTHATTVAGLVPPPKGEQA